MHFDFIIPVLYTDAEVVFYGKLAKRLEGHGARCAFIALTRRGEARLKQDHRHVFYLYEGFDRRRPVSEAQMRAVEDRYHLVSIADHVFSEQLYPWAKAPETLYPRAVHVFSWLERFLGEHQVSFFLNNIGGEIVRRTMARFAEAGGPRNLIVDFAPLHGRLALTTSEVSWDDLPAQLPALTPEQRRFTEELVASVTDRRQMFCGPSKIGLAPRNFRRLVEEARVVLEEGEVDYSLTRQVWERAEKVGRRLVNRFFYQQPVPGERYVFFPLHLASDSAITIRAPQFQRQENLVQYLAERALPTGVTLYVKPHVGARDAYSIPMMAKIRSLPRVRLIEPTINSHQLIAGAEAMVVINSTVGFESLFYGKPVVVLGRVFYRGFGVTTDVENLADLRLLVRQAIANPPSRERVLRFLHACYQGTSPGRFANPDDDANLDKVCQAIVAKVARLGVPLGAAPRPAVNS